MCLGNEAAQLLFQPLSSQDRGWAMLRLAHEACSWSGLLPKRSDCRWKGGLLATAFLVQQKMSTARFCSSIGTGTCATTLQVCIVICATVLRAMMRSCDSSSRSLPRFGGEPASRQAAMPHIKSYARYRSASLTAVIAAARGILLLVTDIACAPGRTYW